MPDMPDLLTRTNSVSETKRPSSKPEPSKTEVAPRAKRRTFTAAYKLRIIEEADQCTEPGEIGALLRREGLYSSSLSRWRRQYKESRLQGLTPKKRGRKKSERDELAEEVDTLRREKQRLEERLEKAEIIIDVQKKLSALLGGTPPESITNDQR